MVVKVETWIGGSTGNPNKVEAPAVWFKAADDPTVLDFSNPITLPPPDETANSQWVYLALSFSGDFESKTVSNIRFFVPFKVDWNVGEGGDVLVGYRGSGDIGCPEDQYVPPSTEDLETHPFYSGEAEPVRSLNSFTYFTPGTLDSGPYSSPASSKALVLQLRIGSDADWGVLEDFPIVFRYDEV